MNRAASARLADGSPLMSGAAVSAFRAHALAAYPEECLGWIGPRGGYHRAVNAAPDRRKGATLPQAEAARLVSSGQMRALCHSHPDGHDAPSEPDMIAQLELMVPFVLTTTNGQATSEPFAWGDQLALEPNLIGRPFRHGVTDCFALIRDWYRLEFGVLLPEYPRSWNWWEESTPGSKDLYQRGFGPAGFAQIDCSQVRHGDVWLAAIRSEVPNHGGVFLDGGLTLHHSSGGRAFHPERLSKREPMAKWAPFVTHWLRRG